MKYSNIHVEFKKGEESIKTSLEKLGATNIDITTNCLGQLEIKCIFACPKPEEEIKCILSSSGAKDIHSYSNYNGASFDYKLDDKTDEREFKRKVTDLLIKYGYRAF